MGNPVKLDNMDYGPGIGAVSSNGGVLICGGEKNVMNGPLDNLGGKVNKHRPSDTFLSVYIWVRKYLIYVLKKCITDLFLGILTN